tara:strand:+ start:1243 stop:2049 length:807 start_codon:yes stop_codon:yes gene_type:complete
MLDRKIIKKIITDHGKKLRPKSYQQLNNPDSLQQLWGLYKYIARENKAIDVIECGCSWGQNAYIELTRSTNSECYYPIKSWTGYECESTNCDIIDEVFNQLKSRNYTGPTPKFIHSAISGSRAKTVKLIHSFKNATDDHTIATQEDALLDRIFSRHPAPNKDHVPNTHYKKLPKCDLLIVDIEGIESQIDFSKIDAHYYHVETHHPDITTKLKEQVASSKLFKLLDVHLCHKHNKHLRRPGTSDAIISFKRISRDSPRQLFQKRVKRN